MKPPWWLGLALALTAMYGVQLLTAHALNSPTLPDSVNGLVMLTLFTADAVAGCMVIAERIRRTVVADVMEQITKVSVYFDRRFDAIANMQVEHSVQLETNTGEIPRLATSKDVVRLESAIDESDRDRDKQIAAVHDAIQVARENAAKELQESMAWVIQRFEDLRPNS